jgi:hypothetical protein
VATIPFELRTEFLVKALVVTVRNGHLASLRAGTCEVTVTLAAVGVQLATRQAHLELPLLIRLPLRIRPSNDSPQSDTAACGYRSRLGGRADWSTTRYVGGIRANKLGTVRQPTSTSYQV